MRVHLYTSRGACTSRKWHQRFKFMYVYLSHCLFNFFNNNFFKLLIFVIMIFSLNLLLQNGVIVFIMIIQPSVKNQLIVDLAHPVPRSDFTSMRNTKHAGHLFIPDVVAIATDSRLSNLALTVALGVSSGYEIANEFLILFHYCRYCRSASLQYTAIAFSISHTTQNISATLQ